MNKLTQASLILITAVAFSLPVMAKGGGGQSGGQGHGAGGVRSDHASDMGMEKGKAWAGSKETSGGSSVDEAIEKTKKEKKLKEQKQEQEQLQEQEQKQLQKKEKKEKKNK